MLVRSLLAASLLLVPVGGVAFAKGKDAGPVVPVGPAKTGKLDLPDPVFGTLRLGVPADYTHERWYPLLFVLPPGGQKAQDWADAWSEVLMKKGWIVAAPNTSGDYGNESSVEPINGALRNVMSSYRIDDRRVVIAGHSTGANMAWRMAIVHPELFAGIVAMNGGVGPGDQGMVKKLTGKPAFLFTGAKDKYYPPETLKRDQTDLEFVKLRVTSEVRPDWGNDFSITTVPKVADWLADVWPPGTYRDKAKALEAAVAAKDFQAGGAALRELLADLKKNPYPAFSARADELGRQLLDAGRALLQDARSFVEQKKPLVALERAEAAVKALKGLKPVDAEAAATLAALRKDPAVVEALAQKKAEEQVSSYMERAAAAELKGDLAKALEWYRKVVALGASSRKAEAEAKVAELAPRLEAGGMESK